MKRLVPFLALLLISAANAPHLPATIKVAVVDTGLDLSDPRFKNHICPTGHKNFVEGETLKDVNDHGTHVAGLIQGYAGNSNYCFLIYKYYTDSAPMLLNLSREILAFQEAVKNGASVINFSGGGPGFNEDEALFIKYHPEVTFVVAAGNEGKNLDIPGNEYYPASLFYGNMEVVGGIDRNNKRVLSSNYGKKVENKELGQYVYSYLPNGKIGPMTGTSMATAIHTGKLIKRMSDANQ